MSETSEPRAVGRAVGAWWRRLQPDERGQGGDRGALARLRRTADPAQALLQPETLELYGRVRQALGRKGLSDEQTAALATAAAVLTASDGGRSGGAPFAAVLGRTADGHPPQGGERPLLSAARFGAMMRAGDWNERFTQFRRGADILGGKGFDIVRFADDLFWWGDETRRQWIFDFYQQGRDVPGRTEISGETDQ